MKCMCIEGDARHQKIVAKCIFCQLAHLPIDSCVLFIFNDLAYVIYLFSFNIDIFYKETLNTNINFKYKIYIALTTLLFSTLKMNYR